MSAAIAATSAVPGVGTVAALGLTGAQIATDAMGITGGNYTASAQQAQHVQRAAQVADAMQHGTYQQIQAAANSTLVHQSMSYSPVQRSAQETIVVNSTSFFRKFNSVYKKIVKKTY